MLACADAGEVNEFQIRTTGEDGVGQAPAENNRVGIADAGDVILRPGRLAQMAGERSDRGDALLEGTFKEFDRLRIGIGVGNFQVLRQWVPLSAAGCYGTEMASEELERG